MADNIKFSDAQVSIEIIDSVLGKMTVSDMAVEDPSRMDYVRNKQLYQKALVPGSNIVIDADTNTISAQLTSEGVPLLISSQGGNAVTVGSDGLLYVSKKLWLQNGGTVNSREDLPTVVDSFVVYMILSENQAVYSYVDTAGTLTWHPIGAEVDLSNYVTQGQFSEAVDGLVPVSQLAISNTGSTVVLRDITGSFDVTAGKSDLSAVNLGQLNQHNSNEASHPSILNSISALSGNLGTLTESVNTLSASVGVNSEDIATLTGRVSSNEQNISNLTDSVSANESSISALGGRVTAVESGLASKASTADLVAESSRAQEAEGLKLDKSAVNLNLVSDANFVVASGGVQTLNLSVKNPVSGVTSTVKKSISLATESNDGFMSSQDKSTLSNLVTRVGKLEGQQSQYLYTASSNPTADDIDQFAQSLGLEAPYSGVKIVVSANNHVWSYYGDGVGWRDDGLSSVSQATVDQLGVVKGSTSDGKTYVESDGTMSVNGWDSLKASVSDLSNKVGSVTLSGGTSNGTLKLSVVTNSTPTVTDNIAVTGLASAAYADTSEFYSSSSGVALEGTVGELGTGLSAAEASISNLQTSKANLSSPAFTGIPTVPTASSDTNTTQAASTAFVQSAILASRPLGSATPLMDGVGSAGSSGNLSREDHVHPSDTTRVPVSRTINGLDLSQDRSLNYSNVGAAPTQHGSSVAGTYGAGTDVQFGHVKLSDALDLESGATSSVAATPSAVKAVNDALSTEVSARQSGDSSTLSAAKTYADGKVAAVESALSSATAAVTLSDDWATVDTGIISVASASAIGNSQLRVTFTPVADIQPDETPVTICSGALSTLLPSLGIRFGGVWDYAKVEQVGFCVFDQDGDLTINAVSTLYEGTEYTLLV